MKTFLNYLCFIELVSLPIIALYVIWAENYGIALKLLGSDVTLLAFTIFFYYALELNKKQPKTPQS